jgi:hypothetical protein
MGMERTRFVVAISILIASVLAAGAATQKIAPSLYRVDGKPVPSSCLAALADSPAINLAHCGDPSMKPKSLPTGFVGYDDPQGGYFYYKYLGLADGLDILFMQSSGGGTGQFTSLVGILRNGQTLVHKKDYAGGDRCNGGVSNAALANGRLTFDQAVTPYDLIVLGDPGVKLQAYKDLEASASSCIADSHMTNGSEHWTGVTLTERGLKDEQGWTEQYRYQSCFNTLYRETVAQGRAELDRNGVKAFAMNFIKRCVRPKS